MLFNVLHCKLDVKMHSIFLCYFMCYLNIPIGLFMSSNEKGSKNKNLFVITPAFPDIRA